MRAALGNYSLNSNNSSYILRLHYVAHASCPESLMVVLWICIQFVEALILVIRYMCFCSYLSIEDKSLLMKIYKS